MQGGKNDATNRSVGLSDSQKGSTNIAGNIFAVFTIFSSAKHDEKIDEEPYAANKN